jgi:Cu/Ag efflux pump CusA
MALFVVTVLNGVAMMSAIKQPPAQGLSLKEAVFEGALPKPRSVLMIASITVGD